VARTPGDRVARHPREELQSLLQEADELTAIFTASYKTAKANLKKKKGEKRKSKLKSPNP
jgi:hypothetical protein